MAAATMGSSKIFPQEAIPRLVVNTVRAFEVSGGDDLEEGGGGLVGEGEVADLVDDQQAGSGEEPHGGGPAAFEGGSVAAGDEIGGGGVVGAIAGVDGCSGQGDGEHGLSDAGRPDEQHVGGVFEEPQRGELVDQGLVDGGLGGEVEVGEPPRRRQRREPFQAGPAATTSSNSADAHT